HELPGMVESLSHLGSSWDGDQCTLVPTCIHLHLRITVFAQEIGEPESSAADDVQGILADGAQVRCGAQLELRDGDRRNRCFDVILVLFPGGVERRKREVVFSHVSYLLDKKAELLFDQRVWPFLLLFSQITTKSLACVPPCSGFSQKKLLCTSWKG